MLLNNFKIAWRNLLKQKLYSFINIAGLATGLACTVLILLWVQDELSYDRFHQNADQIYRLNWDFNWNGNVGIGPGTPPPLAGTLVREIPEVEAVTRVYAAPKMVVRQENRFFNEDRIFGVDSSFFQLFDFQLLKGDPNTALQAPNNVILTEATARKYFGKESPIGKRLTIGEEKTLFKRQYNNVFKVTGIVENPPHNSHFQYDMLTSMTSYPEVTHFDWSWIWMQVTTYAKLTANATPAAVESKIPVLVRKYAPAAFDRVGFSYDDLIKSGGHWDFVLQPLKNIYLDSGEIGNRIGPVGNRQYVYLFSMIAVFVLVLACINFMNLATARSANRAREVGVRKTLGSPKQLLVRQFLVESMLYSFLALPLAMVLIKLVLPGFNQLAGKNITFNGVEPWWLPLALVALALIVGFVAGSYPSFYLSSFQPIQVLKGRLSTGGKSQYLRNGLVVFQFAITIGLIACTFLVQQQMNFLRNADLGFNKEGIVLISNENHPLGEQAEAFKNQLKNDSRVLNASVTTGVPPYYGFEDYYKLEGRGDEQFNLISYTTDEDFSKTMDIKILEGRGFSKEFAEDKSVILNEAAVKFFGWDDPIGKKITYPGTGDFQVIGVMKDFNFTSLYAPIMPFALFHHTSESYDITNSYVVVRLKNKDVENVLQSIENQWKSFVPDVPFEYEFLDESFEQQYVADRRLGTLFLIFSLLTIFIACIGLLGLAAFAAEQRTKEIGIRKVLGASVGNLVTMLSKDFVKLILLASVIAVPLAWWGMSKWLEDFAYRIDIQWWMFAVAGVGALAIALITVSFQAMRAAVANPVESLKNE